jgi:hypothetical protein
MITTEADAQGGGRSTHSRRVEESIDARTGAHTVTMVDIQSSVSTRTVSLHIQVSQKTDFQISPPSS